MSILVTGGAGYIGSHTCIELLEAGYDIVVIDNFSNSHPEAMRRVFELEGRSFPVYRVDLSDRAGIRRIFQDHDIEAVLHFAGLKAVEESICLPLWYYHNNISGTINLCEAMRMHGIKKLIFSSSATVYGKQEQFPITETAQTHATNPYGQTKLVIEQLLQDLYHSDPTWSISILRYFNPIGAHMSGRIGEAPDGIPNNLVPYIAQVAVGKLKSLKIYGNDYATHDGTGIRDYIHVVDLAQGHLHALERVLKTSGIDVFNLGTGQGHSVLDVVETFAQVSGKKIPYHFVERREGDVATCYADPTKANHILGWKAQRDLVQMCEDTWRWQLHNPQGYMNEEKNYDRVCRS